VETVASAELKRAQTLQTLGKVDQTSQEMAMTNAQAVQEILQGQIVQPNLAPGSQVIIEPGV
jgi:hypothetical protein